MTATQTERRIKLNDEERAMVRRRPTKQAVVGVIHFRGPRGRLYRPIRTEAQLNETLALGAAEKLRDKPYAHGAYPTKMEIVTVDQIGRALSVETLPAYF